MTQAFKPKGLRIYRIKVGGLALDGGPRFEFGALVRSKGRCGAADRFWFLRAPKSHQQAALEDWSRGRCTDALR